MKNMKIKMKLLTSFIIVAILTAIVGGVGIFSVTSMKSSADLLNSRANIGIYAGQALAAVYEQRGATRGVALYYALFDNAAAQTQKAAVDASADKISRLLDEIDKLVQTGKTKELLTAIQNQRQDFVSTRTTFIESVDKAAELTDGNMEVEIGKAMTIFAPHIDAYVVTFEALVDYMLTATDEQANEMATLTTTVTVLLLAIAVVAVVAAIALAFYIAGLISPPMIFVSRILTEIGDNGRTVFPEADWNMQKKIADGKDETADASAALGKTVRRLGEVGSLLDSVSKGDLTVNPKSLGNDDTMGNALITMVDNLNGMFGDINLATREVSSGSGQIADGSQSLAQGSTEQAATVQQLSASVQDILEKTKENALMAGDASHLANNIKANAEKGDAQMGEMTEAVAEINKASQDISKVIKVIDDIAFQTNILALNAAVEAARAGEAGKGFAVVADEVRNLASKSAAAAKETNALIENSVKKAELGAKIAEETAVSLSDIVSGINESATLISKIADSSDEQATAINQINEAIEQVSEVVQRNSATAEESAASSEELNAQAGILSNNVAKFKLKATNIIL